MNWAGAVLGLVRVGSSAVNIVHDCDEVFNYWEPLHYVLHGYGMQTWEYSSKFALRSYLYILLHALPAYPAQLLFGDGAGKVASFYLLRAVLGLISAGLEYRLVQAAKPYLRNHVPFLLLLAFSSGTFLAPTTLLPSTFMMYCMISATTGVLTANCTEVTIAAAVGVTLGWPVAGAALLPFALYVLLSPQLFRSIQILLAALLLLLSAVAATDAYFYGHATLSLWNFVKYNVAGGGESSRYGTEPSHFYLLNGLLNFNTAMLLACAYPAVAALQALSASSSRLQGRMLVAISPLFVWLAAISLLPHKEERFLYVVYPHIALAAAVVLEQLPRLASDLPSLVVTLSSSTRRRLRTAGALTAAALLLQTLLFSASRTVAVLTYYRAPMRVWRALAAAPLPLMSVEQPLLYVCTGAEWYRYPSSFFLPSSRHHLALVDSAFAGLSPKAFSREDGGTRAAPEEFNDRNEKSSQLLFPGLEACAFLVEFVSEGATSSQRDATGWTQLKSVPFVEHSRSRFPYRSFWWPGASGYNSWGQYLLWMQDRVAHGTSRDIEPS